jgi:predicted nucleotidyltransferase component of viral defense system
MKVSREKLQAEAQAAGFRPEILERVFHLLNLLERFQDHPFLKGRLALKGGTALNLFLFDLPRLSVDIDLNYVGAAEREKMMVERPKVEQALLAVCSREGLSVARQPDDHAGGKWQLRYDSSVMQSGNLEVDLNYMFRVPLWPVVYRDSRLIGSFRASAVPVLDVHEIAAGKLAALLSRRAGRDLFDAHQLLTKGELNREKLRLGFVLYGAMNRRDWRTVRLDDVAAEPDELRNQLLPLMHADLVDELDICGDWARALVEECRREMEVVLPLGANEMEFLDRLLDDGEVAPQLLTRDQDMADRISSHPQLLWKALNVRKHRGEGEDDDRVR